MSSLINTIFPSIQLTTLYVGTFLFLYKLLNFYNRFIALNLSCNIYSSSLNFSFFSAIIESAKRKDKIAESIEKESLDSFFHHSPFGLIRTDNNGTILLINSSILKIFGFSSREEFISINYFVNKYRNKDSEDNLLRFKKQI